MESYTEMTQSQIYQKLFARYGNPVEDPKGFQAKWMTLWPVPMWLDTHIPALPNKIFVNKDAVEPLEAVLNRLVSLGAFNEIHTWDGCFNIRTIRGSRTKPSIHSWGLAIDLNAANNPLGKTKHECQLAGLVPFSILFDEVFREAGWTCGIDFARADGMHFEYTSHLK
jgi:hypothetical protein